MPFEVHCGECNGTLLVEQTGVVVACPLCGAHLEIPADVESESPPNDAPAEHEPSIGTETAPFVETTARAEANSPVVTIHTQEGLAPGAEVVSHSNPALNQWATPTTAAIVNPLSVPDPGVDEATLLGGTGLEVAAMAATAQSPATPPAAATPTAASGEAAPTADTVTIPRTLAIIVLSYVSAATLLLLYLFYAIGSSKTHNLESLPDLEPPMKDGKIGMRTAPVNAVVAPGHELQLGESQRFGNLKVTPLKITRGAVTFAHAFGTRGGVRQPSQPVLKLWVRFENVSSDQTFAPLSAPLLYKRILTKNGRFQTNNFLVAEADRKKKSPEVSYVFDMPEFSEFLMVGQNLGKELAPGESLETYIPAEEGVELANGPWMWRVQFRKGYHPKSFRGVTTLIDVQFEPDSVTDDESSPS
jgi:hypothetical protein